MTNIQGWASTSNTHTNSMVIKMKQAINKLFKIRHSLNVWLWRKGLATRKQSYQNYAKIPYEKALIPLRCRSWLVIVICIGLIPYIVHQAPYIARWIYS